MHPESSPSAHKYCSPEWVSVPGKTFLSPLRLAWFHFTLLIVSLLAANSLLNTWIIIYIMTHHKRFSSQRALVGWSVTEPDFYQFLCLEPGHFSGGSGSPAELLNPSLMEFLGWLLLRSLPFKDTSARAAGSRSKTDGVSQIKHLASYSLQVCPCTGEYGSLSFCWL